MSPSNAVVLPWKMNKFSIHSLQSCHVRKRSRFSLGHENLTVFLVVRTHWFLLSNPKRMKWEKRTFCGGSVWVRNIVCNVEAAQVLACSRERPRCSMYIYQPECQLGGAGLCHTHSFRYSSCTSFLFKKLSCKQCACVSVCTIHACVCVCGHVGMGDHVFILRGLVFFRPPA